MAPVSSASPGLRRDAIGRRQHGGRVNPVLHVLLPLYTRNPRRVTEVGLVHLDEPAEAAPSKEPA